MINEIELQWLFRAYDRKGYDIWVLPLPETEGESVTDPDGPDLDEIVKEEPVIELIEGRVYLAVPRKRGNLNVEKATKDCTVTYYGSDISAYTFGIVQNKIIALEFAPPKQREINIKEYITAIIESLPNKN